MGGGWLSIKLPISTTTQQNYTTIIYYVLVTNNFTK